MSSFFIALRLLLLLLLFPSLEDALFYFITSYRRYNKIISAIFDETTSRFLDQAQGLSSVPLNQQQ